MGNLDSANLAARRMNAPSAPDNGAAHRAALLDMDVRERALALAIDAAKLGLGPSENYKTPDAVVLDFAEKFKAFITGGTK